MYESRHSRCHLSCYDHDLSQVCVWLTLFAQGNDGPPHLCSCPAQGWICRKLSNVARYDRDGTQRRTAGYCTNLQLQMTGACLYGKHYTCLQESLQPRYGKHRKVCCRYHTRWHVHLQVGCLSLALRVRVWCKRSLSLGGSEGTHRGRRHLVRSASLLRESLHLSRIRRRTSCLRNRFASLLKAKGEHIRST